MSITMEIEQSIDVYDMHPIIAYLNTEYHLDRGHAVDLIKAGVRRVLNDIGYIVENYHLDYIWDKWDRMTSDDNKLGRENRHVLDMILRVVQIYGNLRNKNYLSTIKTVDIETKGSKLYIIYTYENLQRI